MNAAPDILLTKARVVCLRTFDAAEEFDLARAAQALMDQVVSRAAFKTVKPSQLEVPDPPLQVNMGTVTVDAAGLLLHGQLRVKLYATGTASVAAWLDLPANIAISELPLRLAALMDNPGLDRLAQDAAARLLATITSCVRDPRPTLAMVEDYQVVLVTEVGPDITPQMISAHPALPAILLGEPPGPPLSESTRAQALSGAVGYYADELVLLDWNSAFVVDPRGGEDVADILEFATQQLVGFRFYDSLLDTKLSHIHNAFDFHARRRGLSLFSRPFAALAQELALLRVELTEMTEKIDNSLKLVGEPALARVYMAAVEQFRIPQWRVSVEDKLRLVDSLVSLARGENTTGKSLLLETLVVLLILVEIVMGLFSQLH